MGKETFNENRQARIADVQIHQRYGEGRVTLQVEITLEIFKNQNYKVSMALTPSYYNGQKLPATEVLAKTAIVMAGNTHLKTELVVEKPRFYCSDGQGDQNLYSLHVGLKPAGITAGGAAALQITKIQPIDERDYTIGLNRIEDTHECTIL